MVEATHNNIWVLKFTSVWTVWGWFQKLTFADRKWTWFCPLGNKELKAAIQKQTLKIMGSMAHPEVRRKCWNEYAINSAVCQLLQFTSLLNNKKTKQKKWPFSWICLLLMKWGFLSKLLYTTFPKSSPLKRLSCKFCAAVMARFNCINRCIKMCQHWWTESGLSYCKIIQELILNKTDTVRH